MGLVVSIALSIVGYFVLAIIVTNLTGMVVRGFFRNAKLEEMKTDKKVHPFIKQEILKNDRAENVITIVFAIIGIVFLYLLYKYLNIWALITALLLIFSRIPDLVWEIQNGKRPTSTDRPKGGIYAVTNLTYWLALPILWWSIYNL